jgi:hypothetical protein
MNDLEEADNRRSTGGFHMGSRRNRNPDSDRMVLLKSESRRSLLSRGIHKLKKKTIKQKPGDSTQEGGEVSLSELEMLKLQLYRSQTTVAQKETEITLLNAQLKVKDETIEELQEQLDSLTKAKLANHQDQELHRKFSLEEKRMRKRQMESAHSLGLTRSPIFNRSFQSINSAASARSSRSSRSNKNKFSSSFGSLNSSLGSLALKLPINAPSDKSATASDDKTSETLQSNQESRTSLKYEGADKELKRSASGAKLRSPISPVIRKDRRSSAADSKIIARSPRQKIAKTLKSGRELNPLSSDEPSLSSNISPSSPATGNVTAQPSPRSSRRTTRRLDRKQAAGNRKSEDHPSNGRTSPLPMWPQLSGARTRKPHVRSAGARESINQSDRIESLTNGNKKTSTSSKASRKMRCSIRTEAVADINTIAGMQDSDRSESSDTQSSVASSKLEMKMIDKNEPRDNTRTSTTETMREETWNNPLAQSSSPSAPPTRKLVENKRRSDGPEYIHAMNRDGTLGHTISYETHDPSASISTSRTRSRSRSPMTLKERKTMSLRRRRRPRRLDQESNLMKEFLRAEFKKCIKKLIMVNIFFQQTALMVLIAQNNVDVRSFSGSFSDLGDLFLDDEENNDGIKLPRMRTKKASRICLPPPPQRSSMSRLPSDSNGKPKKNLSWGEGEKLYRVRLMPYYDRQWKKDCFYRREEIQKFRFEKVRFRDGPVLGRFDEIQCFLPACSISWYLWQFMEEHADEFELVDESDDESDEEIIDEEIMYDDDIISYDESLDLSGLPGRP